jgi:hypothetical protein
VRRDAEAVPQAPPSARFVCRACGVVLTTLVHRVEDAAALGSGKLEPLVPEGTYWRVSPGHLPTSMEGVAVDFTGCYAIRSDVLVGVGEHPDPARWSGCCGPSGARGPNRTCRCGRAVATERSDCMWPAAVYLDPRAVYPAEPGGRTNHRHDG